MDFVERWFGATPDGGTGSFELLLLGLLTVTVWQVARHTSIVRRLRWRAQLARWAEVWCRHAELRDSE